MTKLRVVLLPIAVLCALGLASCGSDSDSASSEAEATTGGKASPATVPKEAESGETADDGSFDTGTIEEGKIQSETFKQPGTYAYHCEIHPTMHGTVEVVENE